MKYLKTCLAVITWCAMTSLVAAADFPAPLTALAPIGSTAYEFATVDTASDVAQSPGVDDGNAASAPANPGIEAGQYQPTSPEVACLPEAPADKLVFGVMPFYALLEYGNGSIKSHGNAEGSYFYLANSHAMLEFNGQETDIAYRDGFNLSQQDYTTIATFYPTSHFSFRVGNHTITNNDPTRTNAAIWFGGLRVFEKDRWEVGVDGYVSLYNSFIPDALTISQITPRASVSLSPTLWIEAKGYFINSNDDLGLGHDNFFSGEGRISKIWGAYTLSAYGYAGQQIFAVRNDGFIVWNLAEEHHGGFGGEVAWKIRDNVQLTTRVGDELFKDLTTEANTYQFSATVLLMFTF